MRMSKGNGAVPGRKNGRGDGSKTGTKKVGFPREASPGNPKRMPLDPKKKK